MAEKEKVLVVEDDPIVSKSCERILKGAGFDVVNAYSGRDGISKLEQSSYGLVLTDLKMPDINGIELIRWIKKSKIDTNIVIITGYPSQETIKEALNLGIIDYIPKPFTPNILIDVVSRGFDFQDKKEKKLTSKDELPPAMMEELGRVIVEHQHKPGTLIHVLERAQEIVGYLPPYVQRLISRGLRIPEAEIHSVVSFYHFFTMKPKGDHVIKVCLGTACYAKRAEQLIETFQRQLGIKLDEVTYDRKFSLEGVRCLGVCGLAPVVVVDQDAYGMMDEEKVKQVIELY